MFGVTWNDDAEMWLFKATQDLKTIEFDKCRIYLRHGNLLARIDDIKRNKLHLLALRKF